MLAIAALLISSSAGIGPTEVWVDSVEINWVDQGPNPWGAGPAYMLFIRDDGRVHDWINFGESMRPQQQPDGSWQVVVEESRWRRAKGLVVIRTWSFTEYSCDFDVEVAERERFPIDKRRPLW